MRHYIPGGGTRWRAGGRGGEAGLCFDDNGGGMEPDRLWDALSLGFSMGKAEDKSSIGRYGNGLKSSSMRLGRDTLVATKCHRRKTYSIGMLSQSFLRTERRAEVVVPILDYDFDMNPLAEGDQGGAGRAHRESLALILKVGGVSGAS